MVFKLQNVGSYIERASSLHCGLPKWLSGKRLCPPVQETQVHSLSQEEPLEKEMTTHSSFLAWNNPMDRGAWWALVHGVTKSQTHLSTPALPCYGSRNQKL